MVCIDSLGEHLWSSWLETTMSRQPKADVMLRLVFHASHVVGWSVYQGDCFSCVLILEVLLVEFIAGYIFFDESNPFYETANA